MTELETAAAGTDLAGPAEYLRWYEQSLYRRVKVQHIKDLIGNNLKGSRLLDFGGGGGYMARWCAQQGALVTLVEDDPQELAKARSLLEPFRDQCVCLLGHAVPPDLKFDVIVAKDVVEHVREDTALLGTFARAQAPGGRLVVSTQSRWSLTYALEATYQRRWLGKQEWCGWDDTHVRFYTPLQLRELLVAGGYQTAAWRSTYIVPYDVLSWFVLRRRRIVLPQLASIDRVLGRHWPANRLGWNLAVAATRVG